MNIESVLLRECVCLCVCCARISCQTNVVCVARKFECKMWQIRYFGEGESYAMCIRDSGWKHVLKNFFYSISRTLFLPFSTSIFSIAISIYCSQDVCTWWFCTNELCLHKLLLNEANNTLAMNSNDETAETEHLECVCTVHRPIILKLITIIIIIVMAYAVYISTDVCDYLHFTIVSTDRWKKICAYIVWNQHGYHHTWLHGSQSIFRSFFNYFTSLTKIISRMIFVA